MANKEDIRPIYTELKGYLSQAPMATKTGYLHDVNISKQVNQAINELNSVSGEDYSRFETNPSVQSGGWSSLALETYRTKLGGLILRLHAEYFSDEPTPFSGTPSTVITQTQQQSQSIQVQMLLDFQSKIDEKINQLEPGDKKRSFLEKIKEALASVRDYSGLIALYVTTAHEFGLTLEELFK